MRKGLFVSLVTLTSLWGTGPAVVDRDMSAIAGAYDLRATHSLLMQLEDRYLGTNENKTAVKHMVGRFFELILWNQVNSFLNVTQHEVFGHGYRLRSLGHWDEKYVVTPWFGYTKFEEEGITSGQMAAIAVAGMEAEGVLSHQIKMEMIEKGVIEQRLAGLYEAGQFALTSYAGYTVSKQSSSTKQAIQEPPLKRPVVSSEEEEDSETSADMITDEEASNDVLSYLELVNALYPESLETANRLFTLSLLNLVDPMTIYAMIGHYYYIVTGKNLQFPMIRLHSDLTYLPNLRVALAPFAPEIYFENYFAWRSKPIYAYVKYSARSVGFGLEFARLWATKNHSLGFKFDAWQQPFYLNPTLWTEFKKGASIAVTNNEPIYGLSASFVNEIEFSPAKVLFAEFGAKTEGYLPGYGLGSGFIGRLGFSFRPGAKKTQIIEHN